MLHHQEDGAPRLARPRAPSAQKVQELTHGLAGQRAPQGGEELLRALVRLSTERVLPEALAQEQAAALGRSRYERQPLPRFAPSDGRSATRASGQPKSSTIQPGNGQALFRMQRRGQS